MLLEVMQCNQPIHPPEHRSLCPRVSSAPGWERERREEELQPTPYRLKAAAQYYNAHTKPSGAGARWAQCCSLSHSTSEPCFPAAREDFFFYSNAAATLLQTEEPSSAVPVQIYLLHHSHSPQGPIRLRSHALALSAGCTV